MGFFNWLVNKIRFVRYALSTRTKLLTFGAIYSGSYLNWKHDPTPLIWVQYSDARLTHGINIHYLNSVDKAWLLNTIYILKRSGQSMDGRVFYNLLKQRRPSIPKIAYRVYFTNMLNVKLVSAGITPLDKMVYTTSTDSWVAQLNSMTQPSEIRNERIQVSYGPTELRDRIIQAQNAVDIRQSRVGSFGKAPYLK